MISSRLPADLSPNATARVADALRARGVSLIDLTESNPTRVGLSYSPGLLELLANPVGLGYQPHPLGMRSAREAVAADYARRGFAVTPEHIALTASTSEAYGFLFKLFCNAGDAVLVPQPSYPLFEYLTRLESVDALPYALEYHGAWRIDVDGVRKAATERTRALLVVSPNNPTGSFLHADDLVQIAEWCASRDIALIGDEVFADYPLDPAPHARSVLSQSTATTCALGGLSKSIGLPQLKLGWIAFNGPVAAIAATLSAYEVIADAYLSVSTPVQVAAPELLRQGAAVRAQIQTRLAANLRRLRELAATSPAVRVLPCEGGWSAVVQVPAIQGEESLVLQLLDQDAVLVHPGYFFDFPREAFVVVSLLVQPLLFEEGVSRLLRRAIAPPSPS
jgi:aspartate/methionine/tyrosine aminotransferase